MKKQKLSALILITVAFAAFTLGLFLGRNYDRSSITVSVPAAMRTAPPETTRPLATIEETQAISFPININSATKEEWMALPGIGEVLADRILAYRDSNGPFRTVEGLMAVEGIGEKRIEEILEFITIGG